MVNDFTNRGGGRGIMKNRGLMAALVGVVCVAGARAAPYSILYTGDDYPENSGWTRAVFDEPGGPGAVRSLNGGIFGIDSTRSDQIADIYGINRPVDPGIGEIFEAEWRLRVLGHSGFPNGILGIARDNVGTLSFSVTSDMIYSDLEHWSIPIQMSVFHTFRLTSEDMVHYNFWIDGAFVRSGLWDLRGLNHSYIRWGDNVTGGNTLVRLEWDYLSFCVTPEPGCGTWAIFMVVFFRRQRC